MTGNSVSEFIIRTEDLRVDEALDLFVETERDQQLVSLLMSQTPAIIEGSRGTGKSLLLRVCEQRQLANFATTRVLPIYVSFNKSSLLNSPNQNQFLQWMLSRICATMLRSIQKRGLAVASKTAMKVLSGASTTSSTTENETRLEQIAATFEASYKRPDLAIDDSPVPSVEDFKDAVQDICEELEIKRFNVLFDEAAHIFRPEQQRQFFTLFRDLRSPYMTCNAAVYPGVTAYGAVFETTHDATVMQLSRDIQSPQYLAHMREIVFKQAGSDLQREIERNGANFDALAYAVTGNPRLLLKTVSMCSRMNTLTVQTVLKEFFRDGIWSEHSSLSERYPGHRELIDWGKTFLENTVIPELFRRNEEAARQGKIERAAVLWLHRDTPAAAKEAIRLMTYTGVLTKLDEGVLGSWSEPGTRYLINIGCAVAPAANAINAILELRKGFSIKRFASFGFNHTAFTALVDQVGKHVEADSAATLQTLLNKPIGELDLTDYQRQALISIGLETVRDALNSKESDIQTVKYIGPVRSRQIMNVVTSAALEFLSG